MRALPGCPSPGGGGRQSGTATSSGISAAICFECFLFLVFPLCQNALDYIDAVPW